MSGERAVFPDEHSSSEESGKTRRQATGKGRTVTGRSVTGHSHSSDSSASAGKSRRGGRVVASSSTPSAVRAAWSDSDSSTYTSDGEKLLESPVPTSKDDLRAVLRGADEETPDFLVSHDDIDPPVQEVLSDPAYGGTPGVAVRSRRLRDTPRIDAERVARIRHRVFVILRTILVIALVIALFWALLYSPLLRYDATQAQVDGVNQWVDGDEVTRIIEEQDGKSLLVLETERMRGEISDLTGVSEVTVRRRFPHGLDVSLTCAQPAAVLHVTSNDTLVPVTEDGVVLRSQADSSAYEGIARIDVPSLDAALTDDAVLQAVKVMAGFTPALAARITSMSAPTRDSITSTTDNGVTVLWGDAQDIELKVSVVERILLKKDAGDPDFADITDITVSSPYAPIVK